MSKGRTRQDAGTRGKREGGGPGSMIGEYHAALISGETTCEERVAEELENIAGYSKKFNAFITTFDGDEGLALSRSRVLDERLRSYLAKKRALPALFGVPLTIKDNTFFGGFPATNGSKCFTDFVPATNATVVDQLLEAGTVPLGKTNMHELALGIFGTSGMDGPIHNPVDHSRVSGGSSGGAAVSVALSRGALVATGSDTGGSVRVPAALCGVCGFKPSSGLLSTEGLFPLSGSLDHSGVFAKTMPDLVTAFRSLTSSNPVPSGRRLRVGVPNSYFVKDMDPSVSKDFWRAIEAMRSSDKFQVDEVDTRGPDYRRYSLARAVIQLKEASWFYESILRDEKARKVIHQDVLTLMDRGLRMGMLRYMGAMTTRLDAMRTMSRYLKGRDVIAMPSCLVVAPKIDEVVGQETGQLRSLMLRNSELFNLTGLPAISLPTNLSRESLPTGLQLVGEMGQDELVLAAAERSWDLLHGTGSHR